MKLEGSAVFLKVGGLLLESVNLLFKGHLVARVLPARVHVYFQGGDHLSYDDIE